MAAVLNGSSQYFTSTAFVTAAPFTIAGMFNVVNVTADHYLVGLYKAALDTSLFRVRAAGATGGDPVRISVQEIAANDATSTSTGFSADTWTKFSYVATSSTSRTARINNGSANTGVVDVTPTGIDSSIIGAAINATVKSGFLSGSIANICVWNVVLAAADLAKHQANYDPWYIQRASLKVFARFDGGPSDYVGVFTITEVASPTYATSPGLITPRPWIL